MTVTASEVATRAAEILSRPASINGLTVPNRIVMAPMTRMFSPGGIPGEDVVSYYARRAAAGDAPLYVLQGIQPAAVEIGPALLRGLLQQQGVGRQKVRRREDVQQLPRREGNDRLVVA